MNESNKRPYGQLSSFYFLYFSTLGILIPYWGLYLQSLSFTTREIGELFAILVGTKLIAPYPWAWLADYTGKRTKIVQLGAFLAAVSFMLVYNVSSYWTMAAVMVLYSFFWNAIIPQFDVITINYLGEKRHHYSVIRSWGSIGFIVAVALIGPLIDQYGAKVILQVAMLVFILIWLSSMLLPADKSHDIADDGGADKVLQIVKRPEVLALLIVFFLMQFSHGAYYTFFSIYLEDHGYSKTVIGQYWALGVIAEVIVFLGMAYLMKRFGAKRLLIASLLIAAVRWILTAWFVDNPFILFFSQTFHAATFGIYHAVSVFFIHYYFTGKLQGRGQALYNTISFGAGGAMGSLVSGYSWGYLGPTATYMIAAGSVMVATVIALVALKDIM